jgi:murein DD-endopeptidase MepM/ murein hydrolase activator NlpD
MQLSNCRYRVSLASHRAASSVCARSWFALIKLLALSMNNGKFINCWTWFLLSLALALPLHAKQLYKWTDANGVMHFSDQPPADKSAARNLSARLIDVDPQNPVRLREEKSEHGVRYYAYNDLGGYASLSIRFTDSQGVSATPQLPAVLALAPKQESLVLTVQPSSIGAGGRFGLSYQLVPGRPDATADPSAVYLPPFEAGKAFDVHQGFGGAFSHSTPENYHAVDFAMPVGTPVLAARAGRVVQVQDDFYRSGQDLAKFGERANIVVIEHSDGTMAVYAHLDLDSVLVGVGRRVEAGQMLGKSGNTGFSTGPHLHFVVQVNRQGRLESVPFTFTVGGALTTPITDSTVRN